MTHEDLMKECDHIAHGNAYTLLGAARKYRRETTVTSESELLDGLADNLEAMIYLDEAREKKFKALTKERNALEKEIAALKEGVKICERPGKTTTQCEYIASLEVVNCELTTMNAKLWNEWRAALA